MTAPDYTCAAYLPPEVLERCAEFGRAWVAWIEAGAPGGEPFGRASGLCWNGRIFGGTRTNTAVEQWLFAVFDMAAYPFGVVDFYRRKAAATMHLCPRRWAACRAMAGMEPAPHPLLTSNKGDYRD